MTAVLVTVVAVMLVALAAVQLASDAIFSSAGSPRSFPARLNPALGVKIYSVIAKVAPASYVDAMLARAALDRGDFATARRYALRLPDSNKRDDLLGRIALASGDRASARHHFLRADDLFAISGEVDALARTDPAAAFALESQLLKRLEMTSTHPDALAQAHWRLGTLAFSEGDSRLAMTHYREAVELSPLSEKYLLWAGFQAFDLGDTAGAETYFQRAIAADPGSAQAYAGAGLAALRLGDRTGARADAERAAAIDPNSPPVRRLLDALR